MVFALYAIRFSFVAVISIIALSMGSYWPIGASVAWLVGREVFASWLHADDMDTRGWTGADNATAIAIGVGMLAFEFGGYGAILWLTCGGAE